MKADSLTYADGAAVTQWDDVSGNGLSFTQGTVSEQPSFVASDSDYNNYPQVHFDGSDALGTVFNSDLNSNNMTVFVVSTVDSDDGNYHGIVENRDGNDGWILYARMTSSYNYWQWRTGTGSAVTTISASNDTVVPNTPSIVTMKIEGSDGAGGGSTTQTLYVNGNSEATSSAVYTKKTSTTAFPVLGDVGSYELTGQIAEVIQYNRALSTIEIKRVESYLATKYVITGPATWKTSNPYETLSFIANTQTNFVDKNVKFLVKPVRMLDKQHVEIFRPNNALHSSSPQYGANAYSATGGGKYGMFAYDMPNARASSIYMRTTNPDMNPPYVPVYRVAPAVSLTDPVGTGPKLLGSGMADFSTTTIGTTVSRMVISENTLQHHRADASRRRTAIEDDEIEYRLDYSIEPRFSQSLHPKGHKGDVDYNASDHSGDGS